MPSIVPGYSRSLFLGAVLVAASLWPGATLAETLPSDGTAADTQAQIDAAADGDVVQLPVGMATTWATRVSLGETRAVTLDLNGATVTLDGGAELVVSSSQTGLGGINRVTNGSIVRGSGHDPYGGTFEIDDSRDGAGVRVDHITFTGQNVLIDIGGRGPGVMDNCDFPELDWAQEFIHVNGWGAVDRTGWETDEGAALAGSGDIFYIEDCTFTNSLSDSGVAWIQGYYGARVAIRHDTFDWVSVDMHGTAGNIGARWWEAYENVFDNDSPSGQPAWAFSMRAGSGVLWGNRMASGAGHAVGIGMCEEDTGYPASDQIGRGLDQALDPAYVWDNDVIGLSVNACDAPEQPDMVQIGRDVYELARPGYAPYPYPHPLRDDGAPPPPDGGVPSNDGGGVARDGGAVAMRDGGGVAPVDGGAPPPDDDGGCGCRVTASPAARDRSALSVMLFALLLTLARARGAAAARRRRGARTRHA